MLRIDVFASSIIIIIALIIVVCSIGIIIASRFQQKHDKKYRNFVKLLEEKGNIPMMHKDSLDFNEINKVDNSIDINVLMKELYNIFLDLQNRINNLDNNFDDIMYGLIKEVYKDKINSFQSTNRTEVTDSIELIEYSITEFNMSNLKFRIHINCFNYKKDGERITSGSNLDKVEQILIVSYERENNKWLISNIEKVYENKLNK